MSETGHDEPITTETIPATTPSVPPLPELPKTTPDTPWKKLLQEVGEQATENLTPLPADDA